MSEAPNNPAPQILVVDDDTELLKLIAMLLRRIGADAHTFYSGKDALQYLTTMTPELIILDLMMPEIDGFEVLRQIRKHDRFDEVPILILSAKADPTSIRKGLAEGADGYVTKPYIANSLIDRVRLLLSVGRQAAPNLEPPTL
ncbi:MAG: response regulator [Anaerolineae bacterium]|nr:response regulator [Anaerolineae bacterium]